MKILILPFLLMQAWGWMLAQAMTVPWTDRPCLAHGVLVFQCHALCCLSSEAGAAQLLHFMPVLSRLQVLEVRNGLCASLQLLVSTHWMPGTVLGPGESVMRKIR